MYHLLPFPGFHNIIIKNNRLLTVFISASLICCPELAVASCDVLDDEVALAVEIAADAKVAKESSKEQNYHSVITADHISHKKY